MDDLSNRLRLARERQGLSIEDISARTKIKPALLQALERGEFERLPGEFFTRAFLKTYANEVRLSPADVLQEYDRRRGTPHAPPEADSAPPAPVEKREARVGFGLPAPQSAWPLAALIAAILVVTGLLRGSAPDQAPLADSRGTTGTAGSLSPEPPPADSPEPAALPVAAANDTLRIEIRPTRAVWVTGSADGTRVLFRIVEAGERVTIEAEQELRFRVGDAGAFDYSLNGVSGKPPGRPGEVREFKITRDNYQSFLQ